jgi:hypothetical protein
MEKLVLYCKSYAPDLDRLMNLLESIEKFNVDLIPVYISCPKSDHSLFESKMPSFVHLLIDEYIVQDSIGQDWKTQQIIKSQLWKYIDIENYVCLDSDCYFIAPFKYDTFLIRDSIPYTVMHQQKNLFQWSCRYKTLLGFNPMQSFNESREKIKSLYGDTSSVNYDFGPVPVIWSSKVWKSLEEEYLNPQNLKFRDLIEFEPSEFTWYGQSLLAFNAIEIHPIEPLFMVFHYSQQYTQFKQQGYTEAELSTIYQGIVMNSNWGSPIKY